MNDKEQSNPEKAKPVFETRGEALRARRDFKSSTSSPEVPKELKLPTPVETPSDRKGEVVDLDRERLVRTLSGHATREVAQIEQVPEVPPLNEPEAIEKAKLQYYGSPIDAGNLGQTSEGNPSSEIGREIS